MVQIRRPSLVLVLIVGAILAVTVMPGGSRPLEATTGCLICGERWVADSVRNVLLFLPLGAALGVCRLKGLRPYLLVAVLSSFIELAQLFLPGRDANPGDVLFNVIGASVGLWIARSSRVWLRASRTAAARLCLAASAVVMIVWTATGCLLAPALPRTAYYGELAPVLETYSWFGGPVLDVSVGSIAIPRGPLLDSDSVRRLLLSGARLRVRAVARRTVNHVAPIVRIRDKRAREIVILGPDRKDLVYRYRTRADALRLDVPDLRLAGAFAGVALGDTLKASARRSGDAHCLELNRLESCSVGHTLGDGWALLYYIEWMPFWLKSLLKILWMAGLVIPLGYWIRLHWTSLVAFSALIGGVILIPLATGLLHTPTAQILGLAIGLGVGKTLHRVVWRDGRATRVSGSPSAG